MGKSKFTTHYDNLKVATNSPPEVIRAAYRALSQKYHPDKYHDQGEAKRIMILINAAYAVLSDPDQRRHHDEWIAQQEAKAGEEKRRAAERAHQAETIHVPFDDAGRFTNDIQFSSLGIPPRVKPGGLFSNLLNTQSDSFVYLIAAALVLIAIISIVVGVIGGYIGR